MRGRRIPLGSLVMPEPMCNEPMCNEPLRLHGFAHVHGGTTGWRPTCLHVYGADRIEEHGFDDRLPIPATVLDPFAGSGTTGMVAQSLSRRAVLIDLSLDYLGQLMERNREIPLGLAQ